MSHTYAKAQKTTTADKVNLLGTFFRAHREQWFTMEELRAATELKNAEIRVAVRRLVVDRKQPMVSRPDKKGGYMWTLNKVELEKELHSLTGRKVGIEQRIDVIDGFYAKAKCLP